MSSSIVTLHKAAQRKARVGCWPASLLLFLMCLGAPETQGAKLQAENIALDAAKAIQLSSAQNSASLHSSNSSSGFGGGATLGVGEQSGISFQANAGQTLRAVIDGCRCLSLRRPNGMTTRHPQAGLGYMHEQRGGVRHTKHRVTLRSCPIGIQITSSGQLRIHHLFKASIFARTQ